jgi:KRAB domain-containing zinc finger protein
MSTATENNRYSEKKETDQIVKRNVAENITDKYPKSVTCTTKCSICGDVFTSEMKLKIHMRLSHPAKKRPDDMIYKCTRCSEKFNCQESLTSHNNEQCFEKPYSCEFCSKMFISPSGKYRHVRKLHKEQRDNIAMDRKPEQEKPYSCEFCLKIFMSQKGKSRHVLRIHKEQRDKIKTTKQAEKQTCAEQAKKEYKCGKCAEVLNNKACLRQHQKLCRKNRAKQYKCIQEDCLQIFTSKHKLQRHRNVHKPKYECIQVNCKEKFTNKYKLHLHMRVHVDAGETPYSCEFCSAKFKSHRRYSPRLVLEYG